MRSNLTCGLVLVMTCGAAASADITYLSQSRTARCSTRIAALMCENIETAPDFGAFKAVVPCRTDEPRGGYSEGVATIESTLGANEIVVHGTCEGQWERVGESMGAYTVTVFTDVDVVFALERPASYRLLLDYAIGDQAAPPLPPYFTLTGPAGFEPVELIGRTVATELTGTMPSGQYHLVAHNGRYAGFPIVQVATHIDMSLTIESLACAADFNDDSSVDSQDFFDFLGAFFAGDPAADFNNDSVVSSQDFFDFLAAFFGGC